MAIVKSVEYTKETANPVQLNKVNQWGGNLQFKYATYNAVALSANDMIEMISMKEGERVAWVKLTHDALGASVTLDVGDGSDVDRFIDGADGNTISVIRDGVSGGAIGQFGHEYTTDDTIDVKVLGAAATGTIKLAVGYVPAGG